MPNTNKPIADRIARNPEDCGPLTMEKASCALALEYAAESVLAHATWPSDPIHDHLRDWLTRAVAEHKAARKAWVAARYPERGE